MVNALSDLSLPVVHVASSEHVDFAIVRDRCVRHHRLNLILAGIVKLGPLQQMLAFLILRHPHFCDFFHCIIIHPADVIELRLLWD